MTLARDAVLADSRARRPAADGPGAGQARREPRITLDATGFDQPVVDFLRDRVQSGEVVAVWFTYGDQRTESWEGDHLRVSLGKAYMVSRLQALLETGRLHLPRTLETGALPDELLNYELRVDQSRKEFFGTFRTGTQDDLACALGPAVQIEPDCTWGWPPG